MLEFIDRTIIPFFLNLYDAIGYVGVAVAIGLETFVPIIPSEVVVPMAGWKVSQSAADPSVLEPLTNAPWSWVAVLVIATVGAVAGSLAGYLIGAKQFWAMRQELVVTGKMTERAFHDAILKENHLPVEMVRVAITNQKLERDFKPGWRFAGELPDAEWPKR